MQKTTCNMPSDINPPSLWPTMSYLFIWPGICLCLSALQLTAVWSETDWKKGYGLHGFSHYHRLREERGVFLQGHAEQTGSESGTEIQDRNSQGMLANSLLKDTIHDIKKAAAVWIFLVTQPDFVLCNNYNSILYRHSKVFFSPWNGFNSSGCVTWQHWSPHTDWDPHGTELHYCKCIIFAKIFAFLTVHIWLIISQ